VGLTAWLSMLIVVALWVSGQGLQQLSTPAGSLTSLGRLTGLVSADLLLIQVLLMARIPWVERSYGQDVLARRHRWVGFSSFTLMLAHIVLISLGYAANDRNGIAGEVWNLVTTYPGMLLATAGTGLLTMVVITSIKLARRKLRYESWHLLHLYAYLGVGLALPHQLWTGADFIGSSLATAYWWTLYIFAAGSVMLFRLGIPLWRNMRHGLVVDAVVSEGQGVVSIYLRGRQLDRLSTSAGQFFVWRFLNGPGWTRGNPFSLSLAPNGNFLRITAKDLGEGSRRLASLPRGTRAIFEGPYGRLTESVRSKQKITLLACGIGITPLRALLENTHYSFGQATLFYRASTPEHFIFRRELDSLAARRGLRVIYLPGKRINSRQSWLPTRYASTTDEDFLHHFAPDIKEHDIYICGPEQWTEAVVSSIRRVGVPKEQVHTERFAW
jgi:predicted ferric reductase